MLHLEELFTWSEWHPLENCGRETSIPTTPGLYRIRRCGRSDIDYIGQTGGPTMHLRSRLGMLRGVFREEMPYRDPHTAGPALWALRHSTNCNFEASVLPVDGTTPWRKGTEALAISLYRQQQKCSPTANFGRMPTGYKMSSSNNAKLVAAEKRFRGGILAEQTRSHLPSLPPVGELTDDVYGSNWCGHDWSEWVSLSPENTKKIGGDKGLYRIRGNRSSALVYIGQGVIQKRLNDHLKKVANNNSLQGKEFCDAGSLEYSWVRSKSWYSHQMLELENDLIAAHLLFTNSVPPAQFLGASQV